MEMPKKSLSDKIIETAGITTLVGICGFQFYYISSVENKVKNADVYVQVKEFMGGYNVGGFYEGKEDLQKIMVTSWNPPAGLIGPDFNILELKKGDKDFKFYEDILSKKKE